MLEFINLQTNTECPFRCRNCYKGEESAGAINLDFAISVIEDAAVLGAQYVNILGGEPLLFPYICEIVRACTKNNLGAHIATSGAFLDAQIMNNLFKSGLKKLFISLDGSCLEVNTISREGFEDSIRALKIAGKTFPNDIVLLWVFNSHNIFDFENLLILLDSFSIHNLCILKLKYYHNYDKYLIPKPGHMEFLKNIMSRYASEFNFYIDSCYPELIAYIYGNKSGNSIVCGAGKIRCSINADGTFSACPHLPSHEKHSSLTEYWTTSSELCKIRKNPFFHGCASFIDNI